MSDKTPDIKNLKKTVIMKFSVYFHRKLESFFGFFLPWLELCALTRTILETIVVSFSTVFSTVIMLSILLKFGGILPNSNIICVIMWLSSLGLK